MRRAPSSCDISPLQWGRSPKRAETERLLGLQDEERKLQWGRSPKRAETIRRLCERRASQAASMGPLSEESGDD